MVNHPYENHYMKEAFLGFVAFAANNLLDQYFEDCDVPNLARTPLDMMIDEATGYNEAQVQKFFDWCVEQFGHPDGINDKEANKEND